MQIWIYLLIPIISIYLWEKFHIRLRFRKVKNIGIGKAIVLKMSLYTRYVRKYGVILGIALNYVSFYFLFLWRDGMVWKSIMELFQVCVSAVPVLIERALRYAEQFLIFVLPYWRDALWNNRYHDAFSVCNICVIIFTVLAALFVLATSERLSIGRVLLIILHFVGMVNSMYYLCEYLIKIPVHAKLLLAVVSVICSFLVWIVFLVLLNYILSKLDILEKK